MAGCNKINEICLRSEVLVQGLKISTPISMIPTIIVINDGADPNRVESHPLNIIQMVFYSYVPSTTIIAYIRAISSAPIISSKSIS